MKTPQTAVIVIPTYNEADNIGRMIEYLHTKTFPDIKAKKGGLTSDWSLKILVVDGNSPDGTGSVVQKMAKKYPDVYLLTETSKDGIGAAYLKGFKYAMDKLSADYVFEFDGDFQHPPETIPPMLLAMEEGYDYVIGSRKIKGGSNPKGWGLKRVFFSEFGGFVARFIMFFPFKYFFKVTDPTTGLKVTRVKGFVDKMDMDYSRHLMSRSFGYKLQLLFETLKMGAKFKEVPLNFHVRNAGESKIEPKTARDIFRVAILLRWRDDVTKKFLKFGTVGLIGFGVNSVFMEFFRLISISSFLANFFHNLSGVPILKVFSTSSGWAAALGAEMAIISNFLLNNFWTFSKEKFSSVFKLIGKFFQFNLTSIGAVFIQFFVIGLATIIFGDTLTVRQLALIFAIGFLIIPYNWTMYNLVIWRKKK